MTRQEQISQANPYQDIQGVHYERQCFNRGAQWADDNPIDPVNFISDLICQRSIAFDEARAAREKLEASELRELELKAKLEKAEEENKVMYSRFGTRLAMAEYREGELLKAVEHYAAGFMFSSATVAKEAIKAWQKSKGVIPRRALD